MALVIVVALLAGLDCVGIVLATPVQNDYIHPPNGVCTDYTVTEQVTSADFVWNRPILDDNLDVADYLFNLSRKDSMVNLPPIISGTANKTNTYTIAATFCAPQKLVDGKEKTVLLATHGLGFDGRCVETLK